ncbi:MAG: diguanylate cyclase [Bacteroidetes bacterium]|nr:diguanylate cyclase [Bacteroidota bacterium]
MENKEALRLDTKLQLLEHLYDKDPEKGIVLASEVITAAEKAALHKHQAQGLVYLGYIRVFQADLQSALDAFHEALSLFIEKDEHQGIIQAENGIATICLKTQQYVDAIQHLEFIQDLSLETNDIHGLSLSYINLGMAYSKLGEFEKAMGFLSNAEEVVAITQNNQHMGTINLIYGTLYSQKGEFDTALDHLHKALEFFENIQIADMPEVLIEIAKIHSAKGELATAEQYLQTANSLASSNNLVQGRLEILHELGRISLVQQDFIRAAAYFEESFEIAERCSSYYFIRKNAYELFNYYYTEKNYSSAVEISRKIWDFDNQSEEKIQLKTNLSQYITQKQLQRVSKERDLLKRHSQMVQNSNQLIHTISRIGKEIVSILDFKISIEHIYQNISELMIVNFFSIVTYDDVNKNLQVRFSYDKTYNHREMEIDIDSVHSLAAYCARVRKNILINDGIDEIRQYVPEFRSLLNQTRECKSFIFIPLETRGALEGVLTVQSYEANQYSLKELDILSTIGNYIAVSLSNQKNLNKLKQKNDELKLKQKHLELTLEDLRSANRKIEHMATFDSLTGLPNRRLLMKRLQGILSLARRYNKPLGIFFIDLDNFKSINDTLGHQAGDSALKIIADRAINCLRKSDLIARVGGDEFIAVFNDIKKVEDLPIIAMKLIQSFSKPLELMRREFSIGASIGISLFPAHGTTIESLIKNADVALYQAKNSGKGRYSLYSETPADSMESRLDTAFFKSEDELYFFS